MELAKSELTKIVQAGERALGLGTPRRHTSVASWDVVREALHDLKIGRHEMSADEQARLTDANAECGVHFLVPVGVGAVSGMLGTRWVPQTWLLGRSALLIACGGLGIAIGTERSAAHVEERCAGLPGSQLAAAMVATREELEREIRTRRYEVYEDIFKGVSKR
jgi:hypothetical protein